MLFSLSYVKFEFVIILSDFSLKHDLVPASLNIFQSMRSCIYFFNLIHTMQYCAYFFKLFPDNAILCLLRQPFQVSIFSLLLQNFSRNGILYLFFQVFSKQWYIMSHLRRNGLERVDDFGAYPDCTFVQIWNVLKLI